YRSTAMSNPNTRSLPPLRRHAPPKHAPLRSAASLIPPSSAEVDIDDTLEQSFPASDPPAWTLGRHPHSSTPR
ncbi:MAG: hypothetical protein ACREPN_12470, partial [Rudaea sp.]